MTSQTKKRQPQRAFATLRVAAISALAVSGCATGGNKRVTAAAPAASRMPQPETVLIGKDVPERGPKGVVVIADTNPDAGLEQDSDRVTPVKVTVINNSGKRLVLRYQDMLLVSGEEQTYGALPPYRLKLTGANKTAATNRAAKTNRTAQTNLSVAGPLPKIGHPQFTHSGFSIVQPYAPIYPGLKVTPMPVQMDERYHVSFYAYWRQVGQPTPAMLQRALPEGVLEPGGQVSGFVYFERVPPGAEHVRLLVRLVTADDNAIVSRLSLPLDADTLRG